MKKYEEPTIEVLKFTIEDVVTTSFPGCPPDDENAGAEDEFF